MRVDAETVNERAIGLELRDALADGLTTLCALETVNNARDAFTLGNTRMVMGGRIVSARESWKFAMYCPYDIGAERTIASSCVVRP